MDNSRLDKAATFANRYGVSQRKLQKSGTAINNLGDFYNAPNHIKWPLKQYIKTIPSKSGFYSMNDLNSTLQYIMDAAYSLIKPTPRDYIQVSPLLSHLGSDNIKYVFDNMDTFLAILRKDALYLTDEYLNEAQIDRAFYRLFSLNARLKYLGHSHSLPDKPSKTQRNLLIELYKAFKAFDTWPKQRTTSWDGASDTADATAAFMLNGVGKSLYYQRTKK